MRNILIADDNTQILDVLKEYALREGFQVYTAESGKAALEAFSRREYEAVLLDVMMPEIDGFEVCRQIRKKSMVPISGEDFERIMELDIGADDYVVKPFSPSEVMARLRAILRRMDASGRKRKQGRPWKRRMQIERNIQEGTYRKKHTEWQSDGKIDLYKKIVILDPVLHQIPSKKRPNPRKFGTIQKKYPPRYKIFRFMGAGRQFFWYRYNFHKIPNRVISW